jgi:hypothetical protein
VSYLTLSHCPVILLRWKTTMTIKRSAGYFLITFNTNEFVKDDRGAGAYGMIGEIKKRIGHISRSENGFEYDQEKHIWYIPATGYNQQVIEELKQKYFGDPDQLSLL